MRTTVTGIPDRDPMCLFHNVRMWLALANGAEWTDAHIPRTEKPVRFIPYLGFVYPIERLSLHRA